MSANSQGSGKTAQMRRLAWDFAGRLRDKYHNHMSWLTFFFNLHDLKILKLFTYLQPKQ